MTTFEAEQLYNYSWVEKNLDIVSSSIIYTYDVNKTQNSILMIPWFHIPTSNSLRNGHKTMGKVAKQKMATTNSFRIFYGSFSAHP